MSRLEVADLVVIAARALDLEPADALELLDVEAAEAALADARRWCDRDPVEVGAAALLVGLVRHRPWPAATSRSPCWPPCSFWPCTAGIWTLTHRWPPAT